MIHSFMSKHTNILCVIGVCHKINSYNSYAITYLRISSFNIVYLISNILHPSHSEYCIEKVWTLGPNFLMSIKLWNFCADFTNILFTNFINLNSIYFIYIFELGPILGINIRNHIRTSKITANTKDISTALPETTI